MSDELPEYPTVADIAAWRGVTPQAVRQQIKREKLHPIGEVRNLRGRRAKVYSRLEVVKRFTPGVVLYDDPPA